MKTYFKTFLVINTVIAVSHVVLAFLHQDDQLQHVGLAVFAVLTLPICIAGANQC